MKFLFYWLFAGIFFLLFSCSGDHLINDAGYRLRLEDDFNQRIALASSRKEALLSPFTGKLSQEQKEALQFLIAYMPLSDLADYDANFFLLNSDLSLKTRKESSIAKNIPEEIFLHYVLPIRVNNENLDSFRLIYSDELASRIKGLDPVKAALEVNYWCHERVSYQPSDIRTSGPVSTILSARGRCGEESTFTVAALRAAGIPSRQVYTPRWAHSDDNHAWVEFWADGKWYYMGACEPEAVPDRGWFTEPARRAMLVHTRSFGAPSGNENTIFKRRNYAVINNLSKYAVTKDLVVRVVNDRNEPVSGAKVEFQLYNYAEFYPLAVVDSDEKGISNLETGLGDLMIWVEKDNQFGFKKISVSETDTLVISLDKKPEESGYTEYDLAVPLSRTPFSGPPEDLLKANEIRIRNGNSMRKAYIDSWMKPDEAVALAIKTGTDSSLVKEIIRKSMGNYKQISSFILNTPAGKREMAIRLLGLISEKDLRDTHEDVLNDHLQNTPPYENSGNDYSEEIWNNYVLNPRIANELIVKWRKYLSESIPAALGKEILADPAKIAGYIASRIKVIDEENYYNTPITPVGVDQLRLSDSFSRDIYFTALCRTLGIPARLEPGTNRPQYYSGEKWHDVWFTEKPDSTTSKGFLKLVSSENAPVPEYYIHFTLARFANGRYNTLEYDYNRRITDFTGELELDPGYYMLMTGNRISDSRILTSQTFFRLGGNEHKTVDVKLRKDITPAEILGTIDLEDNIILSDGRKVLLKDFASDGLVMIWIVPDNEPTRHIFNDLPLLKKELDAWGGNFLLLTDPTKPGSEIDHSLLKNLPVRTYIASDNGSSILSKVCGGVSCSTVRMPLVILCDKTGNVMLRSEGYRIGIGEQILRKAGR